VKCAKCLSAGHAARFCHSPWRCNRCFHYGHKSWCCLTNSLPRVYWAPKQLPKEGPRPDSQCADDTVYVENLCSETLKSSVAPLSSIANSAPSSSPHQSPLPQCSPHPPLLTVNGCIKVHLYLQADKSPVVVKGPFFSRVVNPRYRIYGSMCNARIQSSKAR
jgi:hypothetical protein